MNEIFVVIPSLNPKSDFFEIVYNLRKELMKEISKKKVKFIIINDGSSEKYDLIYDSIKKIEDVIILKHGINLGKGRALKTSFNYIITNFKNIECVVTADSDGQHSVTDIVHCLKKYIDNKNHLVLGSRNFSDKNIPFRSRFGNKMTSFIFKYLLGISILDTQTGLRVFGKDQLINFIKTKGERYEYETNMLIDNKNLGYKFLEVEIETIYIENNLSSHFNPLKDSIKIYTLFLRYIFVALCSFILDISLFKILLNLNLNILNSTIISRIISSIFNYQANKNKIFKSFNTKSLYKYYFLVIIQMIVSAFSVKILNQLFDYKNILILKILVDVVLFIINYYIQREWVFKKGDSEC